MATGGFRTLKKFLGQGGSGLQPSKGDTEGLKNLLKEIIRDLNQVQTHTHRYDGSSAGEAQSSAPQSTTAGSTTGGTAISFTAFTVE